METNIEKQTMLQMDRFVAKFEGYYQIRSHRRRSLLACRLLEDKARGVGLERAEDVLGSEVLREHYDARCRAFVAQQARSQRLDDGASVLDRSVIRGSARTDFAASINVFRWAPETLPRSPSLE